MILFLQILNDLNEFYINPQDYMEQVIQVVVTEKRKMLVDGIKYEKIGDNSVYAQELFDDSELVGYLKENAFAVSKSVYSHVVYDSGVEKTFAERLENDEDVKIFAKLIRVVT